MPKPNTESDWIGTMFYQTELEHLIQEPNEVTGRSFCETCQEEASPVCFENNKGVAKARTLILQKLVEAQPDLSNIRDWVDRGLSPGNINKDVPYRCLQMIRDELDRLAELSTLKKELKQWTL